MKKIFLLLLPLTMACGCGKFLEEYSQNDIKPSTVEDLQKLMIGEAYPIDNCFVTYLELLTDDLESGFTDREALFPDLERTEGPFTWNPEMFDMLKAAGANCYDTWERYYKHIKGCNVVLETLDDVYGTPEAKTKARGEALALRAYYYFQLVNLYARPYNDPEIDRATEPGVPLILSSTVSDVFPTRASVDEVWSRVEADLLEAMEIMDEYGRNQTTKYRVSDLFVHTLLSRMYLYQERWDKAAEHASVVLERNPSLIKLATGVPPAMTFRPAIPQCVYHPTSPESIWLFSNELEFHYDFYFIPLNTGENPVSKVSASLKACYDYDLTSATNKRDLRPMMYYRKYTVSAGVYDLYYSNYKGAVGGPIKGMRTAESYLNRAEANARMFVETGNDALRTAALRDLNTLREARWDTRNEAYVPVEIADADELLQFCLDERRRELSFEEHRWFDLRRYGMPEIIHTFRRSTAAEPQKYTLKQGGDGYVLPLPLWVTDRNPNL